MAANAQNAGSISAPKKGDQYACSQCGMKIEVTADCPCPDAEHVHFQCCDRDMEKTTS